MYMSIGGLHLLTPCHYITKKHSYVKPQAFIHFCCPNVRNIFVESLEPAEFGTWCFGAASTLVTRVHCYWCAVRRHCEDKPCTDISEVFLPEMKV